MLLMSCHEGLVCTIVCIIKDIFKLCINCFKVDNLQLCAIKSGIIY
jgi:hypothetical protein